MRALSTLAFSLFTFCFVGCGNLQTVASSDLAKSAVAAVAKHYVGDQAGELASAGLSATAEVLQGYVDKKPPLQIAANSPGVKGLSQVVVDYLKTKGLVSQQTVDSIHDAAQIAANASAPRSTVNDGP